MGEKLCFGEEKIPVPNTVGELIEILEKFPKNASLHTYKVEGYYGDSETESYQMSVDFLENIGNVNITFH
jgi:hypothetical protein